MRTCKYCGVKLNDNDINCPLCGAHTTVVDATPVMVPGEYPNFTKKKSPRLLIRNIFLGIMMLILMSMGVSSGLSGKWSLFLITLTSEAYIWLGILQYIFKPRRLCDLINGIFFFIIFFTDLVFLHYGFTGHKEVLQVGLAIVTPILLSILNITLAMIVFISGKFHKYAYKINRLAFIEFIWFIVMGVINYNVVASIVCASLGFITFVVSLVFGRETLITELKKHFRA